MKVEKKKTLRKPDLRNGIEGSVFVKDANVNFAGSAAKTAESGPGPVSPDVGVAGAGQTTHE